MDAGNTSTRAAGWILAIGAALVVAVTGVYAYYAHRQLAQTRDALRQMQALFARDQMPVIWLDPPPPERQSRLPIVLTVDEPIEWTFRYSNYGRTPALRVVAKAFVFPGASAKADVETFFRELPERIPGTSGRTVAMPNVIGDHSVTARSRAVASPEDFTHSSRDGGLYLAGRFEYESTGGTPCRSDFCRFTLQNGAISYCENHNNVTCGQ